MTTSLAEVDETLKDFLEVEDPGLPVVDGQHDDPEGGLHLGVLVELVEDDAGSLVLFQIDDDPDAFPVGFIPQVGDPADLLFLDEFRNLLDEIGLVDLVGQLRDDDAFPVVPGVASRSGPGLACG